MAEEKFSIMFLGPALDSHEIPATSLAESLIALDRLARKAAKSVYGRDAFVEIKVKGAPQAGSFNVDLIIQAIKDEVAVCAGAVTVLIGVIKLAKWACGKKVEKEYEDDNGSINVRNINGNNAVYNATVVNIYNSSSTETDISRLTQTLDQDGVSEIKICGDGEIQEISREERNFFRRDCNPPLK